MNERYEWLRVMGGGCFINLAVTGLLVGLAASISSLAIDSVLIPFMVGATASLGASFYLLRQSRDGLPVIRKAILAGAGVLLGSVLAVLGIAALLIAGA